MIEYGRPASAVALPASTTRSEVPPSGRTVLLCGPDSRARDSLALALRARRIDVVLASTSAEALAAVRGRRLAMMVVEEDAQGQCALEMIRELRRDGQSFP